jgi:hypothetical protein
MAPRPMAPPGTEADPITFSITIQAVLKTVLPVPRLNLNAMNSEEQPPTETEVEDNSGIAPLPEPVYKAPVFRFKFIDGSCEETPILPTGEEPVDGWEEVEEINIVNNDNNMIINDGDENALNGSITGEEKGEEKNDVEGGENEVDGGDSKIIKPKKWKWTKAITIEDGMTETLARNMHNNPNVVCVLANLLSTIENENAEEEDLQGGAEDGENDLKGPKKDINFLSFLPLDTSGFLDGDTNISLVMSKEDFELPDPPEGLLYWSFTISTARPLLTREQRKLWNPLAINTRKVRCLPGITLETTNPKMMKYMQPTRFSLLEKYCEPIFATIKFPPYPINGFQRIIRTCSLPQVNVPPPQEESKAEGDEDDNESKAGSKTARSNRSTNSATSRFSQSSKKQRRQNAEDVYVDKSRRDAKFHCKSVFLTAFMNKYDLVNQLQNSEIKFELHDRDILFGEDNKKERLMKWEDELMQYQNMSENEGAEEKNAGEGETDENSVKLDVYGMGEKAWGDILKRSAESVNINAHGIANFRLHSLLTTSKSVSRRFREASGRTAVDPLCIDYKLCENIKPRKRLTSLSPEEEQSSWDYSDEDRLVRYNGAYFMTSSEVIIDTSIARPPEDVEEVLENTIKVVDGTEASIDPFEGDNEMVKDGGNGFDQLTEAGVRSTFSSTTPITDVSRGVGTRKERLFERAVYCFSYDDNELLHQVQDLMTKVNAAALPGVALRAHQLTEQQVIDAQNGDLDIICGFQVIDDDFRIIVIEGLGSGGMAMLHREVRRTRANGPLVRVLSDPTVRFLKREYLPFHVDLKRIKLRNKLPQICETPDIYNRAKVPLECFEALHRLFRLRNSNRLRHVMESELFPLVNMLLVLESKYGEAISLEDMDGDRAKHVIVEFNEDDYEATDDEAEEEDDQFDETEVLIETKTKARKHSDKRKADTDCWNDAFEQFLIEQSKKIYPNRPKIQAALAAKVKEETLKARAIRAKTEVLELPEEVKGQIFIYSGQKLQYTEFQKEKMRKRLSSIKNATFSYSQEFQSLTLCLVNEDDIIKNAKLDSIKKYTTPSGFVYPAPKDPSEYSKHPRQVSKQRQDELKEPWIENQSTGAPPSRSFVLPVGKTDFDTVPVIASKPFGGYNADGTKAPDHEFYKSVHLGGDGVEAEMVEAKKRAKQEWLDAVMVENIHFNTHYGEKGSKPSQLGKLDSILDGKAKKLGIKVVHNATLPSGKRIPFKPPPATIMALDEFEDPKDFTEGMRPNNVEHFYGTTATGEKVGFITAIHKDENKPFRQRYLHRRKAKPMSKSETVGPKFFGHPEKKANQLHPSEIRTKSNKKTGPPAFENGFSEQRKDGPKYVPPKLPKL